MTRTPDYDERIRSQLDQYKDVDINELPDIFHYWSNRYLAPLLIDVFGESSIPGIYAQALNEAIDTTGNTSVASLGPGDAWLEVDIARRMNEMGRIEFTIELIELSDHLIDRAKDAAGQAGVLSHFKFTQCDINTWKSDSCYAAIIANQSLHHFVGLEHILNSVASALDNQGIFASFDTIGRNGHMRWPEARIILQYFWSKLPEEYHFHHLLKRFESPLFLDWDCSGEGFEGIRAQDILPLLVERFSFTHFAGWGAITDVFTDRGFGHNFRPSSQFDCDFIDDVQAAEISLHKVGILKPTQMGAIMKKVDVVDRSSRFRGNLHPLQSVRDPSASL
jgi:SAM-dependent methyltransferase